MQIFLILTWPKYFVFREIIAVLRQRAVSRRVPQARSRVEWTLYSNKVLGFQRTYSNYHSGDKIMIKDFLLKNKQIVFCFWFKNLLFYFKIRKMSKLVLKCGFLYPFITILLLGRGKEVVGACHHELCYVFSHYEHYMWIVNTSVFYMFFCPPVLSCPPGNAGRIILRRFKQIFKLCRV